jgi:D-cysteine desulfhydrase
VEEYIGPGYARPSEKGDAAIRFMAEKEGIFLDPVYTGKTFAGFPDLLAKDFFAPDENVVFVHIGIPVAAPRSLPFTNRSIVPQEVAKPYSIYP